MVGKFNLFPFCFKFSGYIFDSGGIFPTSFGRPEAIKDGQQKILSADFSAPAVRFYGVFRGTLDGLRREGGIGIWPYIQFRVRRYLPADGSRMNEGREVGGERSGSGRVEGGNSLPPSGFKGFLGGYWTELRSEGGIGIRLTSEFVSSVSFPPY